MKHSENDKITVSAKWLSLFCQWFRTTRNEPNLTGRKIRMWHLKISQRTKLLARTDPPVFCREFDAVRYLETWTNKIPCETPGGTSISRPIDKLSRTRSLNLLSHWNAPTLWIPASNFNCESPFPFYSVGETDTGISTFRYSLN